MDIMFLPNNVIQRLIPRYVLKLCFGSDCWCHVFTITSKALWNNSSKKPKFPANDTDWRYLTM